MNVYAYVNVYFFCEIGVYTATPYCRVKKRVKRSDCQYLVGDLDEQREDDDNKQVVNDADSSDDDVDDLDCTVTDVSNVLRQIIIRRRTRRHVGPDITQERCVLHCC